MGNNSKKNNTRKGKKGNKTSSSGGGGTNKSAPVNDKRKAEETLKTIMSLLTKEKTDPLKPEEQAILDKYESHLPLIKQIMKETESLMRDKDFAEATASLSALKQMADEGDEEALKAYNKVLPDYTKAMNERLERMSKWN